MPLSAGQSLSFYEVLGPLGAGGMGEVYRAKDTRLEREVAIKVLPEELADDEERLRRFEREAKTLASLNHPNVAGIHGIDQVGDTCFLAMELVPGEDLAAILARGRLPVAEAVDTCRQIAEGLEAAHEAGVVHRDLKPANVRVTPEGVVKILDFGLAKSIGPRATKEGTTTAESDSFLVTETGLVLGTPTYMSPEQARGKPVDRRTDIWAYGCVLYECLAGKRAFGGDSMTDVLAAIVEHEPDWSALPPGISPRVRELLERCLVKDPRRRLRDVGEARLMLEATGNGVTAPVRSTTARDGRRIAPLGWLAAVAAAGLAGWWLGREDAAPSEVWSRLTQLTDEAGAETGPSLSPDGSLFAYASRVAGSWDVYVQRVGGRNATPVAADPDRDEAWPTFSPDGSRIAYNESDEDGGIWVVGATGESQRRVTDFGYNPTWSPDGEHIAFCTDEVLSPYSLRNSSLWRVPAAGGEPVQVSETAAIQPAWSPGGARIAYWFHAGGQRDLATVPADGGEPVVLLNDAPLDWSPTWSPDGKYLYFSSDRGGSLGLWRLPIDQATGLERGAAELVLGGVEASVALPTFSEDGGRLLFRSQTISVNPAVLPFDPDTEGVGEPRELLRRTGILRPWSVSPDGKLLALYNLGERPEDLFLMNADGSGLRRLTDDLARDRVPSFSPDGSMVLFSSNREFGYRCYSIRLDGSALTRLTDESLGNCTFPTLAAGSHAFMAYVENVGYVLANPPWPVTADTVTALPAFELPGGGLTIRYASWDRSPDGSRMVGELQREHGANAGIGLLDLTTGEGRLLTEDHGLTPARWLPDGRRIVYFRGEDELAVLDVDSGERRSIQVDLPAPLAGTAFAVAPDGTAIYFGAERVESNIWMVEQEL